MSVRKKVKRNLGKKLNTSRKNKVDAINEQAVADALKNGDEHCQMLHPTGGYYRFSLKRLQCLGGPQAMWAIISETLRKACTEETIKKNAVG